MGLKKVPYQLYEKNSFNVKFMHTCTKKLFLGRVNDKWIKMIEIDELLLFYFFIPCLKKCKGNLGDVFKGCFWFIATCDHPQVIFKF